MLISQVIDNAESCSHSVEQLNWLTPINIGVAFCIFSQSDERQAAPIVLMNNDSVLFSVQTPLGFTVILSEQRWQLIITEKHPVLAGQEEVVKATLESPDEIRKSKFDEQVYLFYRTIRKKRWACVVIKHQEDAESYLITAYPTDAIKEGETLWIK